MNHICLLFCDDERPILNIQRRICSMTIESHLTHDLKQPEDVDLAAEQSAVNPSKPLIVLSENPQLIVALASALAAKSPKATFGLITDGNLLPMGQLHTGHDLIMVLREVLGDRLKMSVLYTGNPDQFQSTADECGYELVVKPASLAAMKELISDFVATYGDG